MTPVHIVWTAPSKENDKKIESYVHMLLSAIMIKEIYGEIHVITDYHGRNMVKQLGIPYDKIYLGLDHANDFTLFPDAKVLAYKMLADLIPGYLYFDQDIFITKPVKKRDIITQCDEGANPYVYCLYKYLVSRGVKFRYEYKNEELRFLNMGLFRCVDKKIIYDYYESYFTTKYQNQYIEIKDPMAMQYAMFLEQSCIYKTLQKHNQLDNVYEHYPREKDSYNHQTFTNGNDKGNPHLILEKFYNSDMTYDEYYTPPSDINYIHKTEYTHLMHYKREEKVGRDVLEFAFKRYPKELSRLMINMKYLY